jgi:hypothetical protein
MRLRDLRPRFYKYGGGNTLHRVRRLADAARVMFLCPACFVKNNGPVGTHSIAIDFQGREMPDHLVMRNASGHAVRWNVSGSGFDDLSLTPSIQLLGGCNWHGFVTNGEIVNA